MKVLDDILIDLIERNLGTEEADLMRRPVDQLSTDEQGRLLVVLHDALAGLIRRRAVKA